MAQAVTVPALTNIVYATNAVVDQILSTNLVTGQTQTTWRTNWAMTTNVIVLPAQTQMVVVTNAWVPSQAALDTAQGIGAAVNIFAPGMGGLVGLGLSGILSLFAAYQTRKAGNHQAAAEALGKAIEQTRIALQSAGPGGQAMAARMVEVIEGHAEAAGDHVADILEKVSNRVGGDTASTLALHAAGAALHRVATAEELVAAAQSGAVPGWFTPAERAAVAKIRA
jgi:hypothetical protein